MVPPRGVLLPLSFLQPSLVLVFASELVSLCTHLQYSLHPLLKLEHNSDAVTITQIFQCTECCMLDMLRIHRMYHHEVGAPLPIAQQPLRSVDGILQNS